MINFLFISFLPSQSIIDAFLIGNNTTILRGTQQDGLITPRDLDFHKDIDNEDKQIQRLQSGGDCYPEELPNKDRLKQFFNKQIK